MTEVDLKVAIIGGGPAGSFSCHFLNKFAKNKNRNISIDLYDYKCFVCEGKSGCNMCAGIISSTLVAKLEQEKIHLSDSVIKSEITGYQLHSKYNTVYFEKEKTKKIYSVFRGQGPLSLDLDGNINSFDQFLLDFAGREDNVSIINKKVTGIDFSHADSVAVKAEKNVTKTYDFVIGAFGVNTKIKDIIKTGYKPPKTMKLFQFETNLPRDFIQETYRGRVHMFPVYKNNIWFITLIPKSDFITVSVVGKRVKARDVKAVIQENKNISHYLQGKELNIKCSCTPDIPVSFSKKPYANRFLVVGDACVSRYLKNGIESAFQTAFFAADTIINHGLSEKAIKKWYFKRCKKEYRFDNLCGRMLYLMDRILFIFPLFAESQLIRSKKEQITRIPKRLSDVLWDMFTGDKRYRTILKRALHPFLLFSMVKEFLLAFITAVLKRKPH